MDNNIVDAMVRIIRMEGSDKEKKRYRERKAKRSRGKYIRN